MYINHKYMETEHDVPQKTDPQWGKIVYFL